MTSLYRHPNCSFMDNARFSPGVGHTGRMAKRSLVLKITAAVLVAGGMVWLIAHFSEPAYQGKTLSVWLDEARQNGDIDAFFSGDHQPDSSTARAVCAIGIDGLPTFIRMVRARDTAIGKRLRELSRSYTWMPIDRRESSEFQGEAAYGFGLLGPAAKSAVPELAALLHDDDPKVRAAAAYCLGLTGAGSAGAAHDLENYLQAVLHVTLKNGSAEWDMEARCALYALGELGPAARSFIPQISDLTNATSTTLIWAKAALIKITGRGLDLAVEPLRDTANLTNWRVACFVARELGSNATPAVPLLLGDLKQTNEDIQADAILALGNIRAHPEQCIPAITPFLRATNRWIRVFTLTTISAFGSSARPWAPTSELIRCLADGDGSVRARATNALRRVDPGAAAKTGIRFDKP
jgi:HEAT repeat protein